MMLLTVIESPYAGSVDLNLSYLRAAIRDSLLRGEAPYASHAIYTQPGVLDDSVLPERRRGIKAGIMWGRVAQQAVFYVDLGWSRGMNAALREWLKTKKHVRTRTLGTPWSDCVLSDAHFEGSHAAPTSNEPRRR